MESRRTTTQTTSDAEFLTDLVSRVERYFRAVDTWETEYHKFYRLPGSHHRVPPDLEDAQREFASARQALEAAIPRARRLCRRFELRDPWPALLRIELGAHAPQAQAGSAVGRNERIAIRDCLRDLEFRCTEPEPDSTSDVQDELPERRSGSLLRRIVDFFF
jgi:hypothetical protein